MDTEKKVGLKSNNIKTKELQYKNLRFKKVRLNMFNIKCSKMSYMSNFSLKLMILITKYDVKVYK